MELLVGDDTNPRSLAFQLDRMAEHVAALPGPPDRSGLEGVLESAARSVVRAPWQGLAEPTPPGRPARYAAIDQLVIDVRGPLLQLMAGFNARWFADPAVVRRVGGILMIRYRVSHRTTYHYGASMTGGQSVLHLVPRATDVQQVVESVVTSDPEPDERYTWLDAFGNLATYLGSAPAP